MTRDDEEILSIHQERMLSLWSSALKMETSEL